jgi:hypothetical protein
MIESEFEAAECSEAVSIPPHLMQRSDNTKPKTGKLLLNKAARERFRESNHLPWQGSKAICSDHRSEDDRRVPSAVAFLDLV